MVVIFAGKIRFESPLFISSIMFSQVTVELPCHTDDGLLVSDVGGPEASGGHTSKNRVRTDYYHLASPFSRGAGCGHCVRRTAVQRSAMKDTESLQNRFMVRMVFMKFLSLQN